MNQQQDTLASRIDASVKAFITALPDSEKRTVEESFAALQASDVAAQALGTGDTAPDFILAGATGYDDGQQNEGVAFAWYGSATGLGTRGGSPPISARRVSRWW